MARLRLVRAVAIAALLAVFAVGESADATPSGESAAARNESDFCGPRVARDFLRPLSKMPPVRHVPNSGKLAFAPDGLTLAARGGRLVVGGGSIGFGFSDEAIEQARRLNWDVSTRLVEVSSKGAVLRALGSKRRRVGTVEGNSLGDFRFGVPGEPAYYRTDISFRHIRSGRVLGEFSNYVRVVRPWFGARLLKLGSVVRPGELLSVRLANFGTEAISSISYNWRFTVQYFNGQSWVIAPSNPPPEKHKTIFSTLGPGQLDQCVHLRMPADEAPGLYRVSMGVDRSLKSAEDRTVRLTAEFEVSGPA